MQKTKIFIWQGINDNADYVNGVNESLNEKTLINELQQKNILPIKIHEKNHFTLNLFNNEKIKSKHLADFSKQFATLINANLPLLTALETIGKDFLPLKFREIIFNIKNEVANGKPLSNALNKHQNIFNEFYCNLIKAGEEAGALDQMLIHLAAFTEKQEIQKRKILKALTYPFAVIVVAFLVTLILLIFVIPQFKEMFAGFGAALPAYTQFIINLAEILQNNFYWLILILLTTFTLFYWQKKHSIRFNQKLDNIKIKLPIIGKIIKFDCIARLTRTLGITFKAGISLLEALKIASGITGNFCYQQAIIAIQQQIANGIPLSNAMLNDKNFLFPNRAIQLIKIGEESGTLDEMLLEITKYYENEINYFTDHLNNLLEPLIMVILGIIVGGLIIAMYLPIFRLGKII